MLHKKNTHTHTDTLPKSKPLWTRQESINFECAKEIINAMLGVCFDKIRQEKLKENPNIELIAKLEEEERRLAKERFQLSWDEHDKIKKIRREYGAIVRAYNEQKKKARLNG